MRDTFKPITLVVDSERELKGLLGLLDAGVKMTGSKGAVDCALWMQKVSRALEVAQMTSFADVEANAESRPDTPPN